MRVTQMPSNAAASLPAPRRSGGDFASTQMRPVTGPVGLVVHAGWSVPKCRERDGEEKQAAEECGDADEPYDHHVVAAGDEHDWNTAGQPLPALRACRRATLGRGGTTCWQRSATTGRRRLLSLKSKDPRKEEGFGHAAKGSVGSVYSPPVRPLAMLAPRQIHASASVGKG